MKARVMNLTNDMEAALQDLFIWPRPRGPSNTGLYQATYVALEKRGLCQPAGDKRWKITEAGRDAWNGKIG
jgi:hypothetical protein